MKVLCVSCLVLFSTSAYAVQVENCEGWKQKASLYMNWRQQGIPIAEAVKETAGNISRGLLLRAYGEPQEQGYEAQYRAADLFGEKIYQECLSEQ